MSMDQPILRVSREIFRESLRRLQRAGKKSPAPVRIEWIDGTVVVSWGNSSERLPAEGNWPEAVHVSASWLKALAKLLPDVDPLTLRVRDRRLYAENYSQPCLYPETPASAQARLVEERQQRIKDATAILRRFYVQESDVESLVNGFQSEGLQNHPPEHDHVLKRVRGAWLLLASFGVGTKDLCDLVKRCQIESLNKPSPQEEAMLGDLANAWLLLAPFGIETKDLYQLVQERIRLAWQRGGSDVRAKT